MLAIKGKASRQKKERMACCKVECKLAISESDFMSAVIDLGHLYGWRIAHFRPGLSQSGRYLTAVQADGAGFPDLVLVRQNNVGTATLIILELKSQKGRLSEAQKEWLAVLDKVPGVVARCARPADWDEIAEMLK